MLKVVVEGDYFLFRYCLASPHFFTKLVQEAQVFLLLHDCQNFFVNASET